MNTVKASLQISVMVNCPGCGYYIDLLDERETDGTDHNDDAHILNQACPINGNCWSEEHVKFKVEEVVCTQCKSEFIVEGMEW